MYDILCLMLARRVGKIVHHPKQWFFPGDSWLVKTKADYTFFSIELKFSSKGPQHIYKWSFLSYNNNKKIMLIADRVSPSFSELAEFSNSVDIYLLNSANSEKDGDTLSATSMIFLLLLVDSWSLCYCQKFHTGY